MAKKETAQAPAKKKAKQEAAPFTEPARLRLKYKEIIPQLVEKFGYENPMQVPKLEKIVLNMGLGSDKDNPKGIDAAVEELGIIAGQKPVITKAKKSVANFKVRQGMNVGAKVTLRGDRMYYFADKLMNIVLPRVRDFRGVSDTSFDGRGNYAMGLKEQLIFPEINYDDVDKVRGMTLSLSPPQRPMKKQKSFSGFWACPLATTTEGGFHNGKDIIKKQAAGYSQVFHQGLHPLPSLRQAPFRSPQVRNLPRLLPRTRLQG